MNIKIKNFGAIADADVKLDGITAICGDNNTGKSTVGKALFGFYNSLFNLEEKIIAEKQKLLKQRIENCTWERGFCPEDTLAFIVKHINHFESNDIKEYLQNCGVEMSEYNLNNLTDHLNTSNESIFDVAVNNCLNSIMNGQIKNVYSNNEDSFVTIKSSNKENTIRIGDDGCKCEINTPIINSAYYIGNPSTLSLLNTLNRGAVLRAINPMDRNAVSAIIRTQDDINADPMTNIIDLVSNKNELECIRKIIKKAYTGDTIIDNGRYFYIENGKKIDFRDLSGGLKSFALIERMLATGVLKRGDVLILDNPEAYLHPEWRIIYAELIVALQKYLELKILITTHSFQFLESLNFFMKKYEIFDRVNYYIPEQTDKGAVMKSYSYNPNELYKNLSKGTFKIADLEYEFDMEHMEED